jgi:glycosyltransferase involved in cell wall biosynthesis
MARVAVAMAVYNDERYLPLALDALCRQQYRDFRLYVLDDGSTDRSAAIVESYADRLPLDLIRAEHRGRQLAKQASWAAASSAELLLVLDSDIALPEDALARMVAAMTADATIAAVSAVAQADTTRRYGSAQAFVETLFFRSNVGDNGDSRWIVGGCVLFRRSALADIEVRSDVGEDNDLSEKLRRRWRLVLLEDVKATHYGVPTTLGGILRRFARDGERVRALLRIYPAARQVGNIARLVPLPLAVAGVAGVATGQLWLTAGSATALAAYVAAFLYASRDVSAAPLDRLAGALLFTFGNLGFGVGYVREALRAGSTGVLRERGRSY